jgi:hypothetical protein
MTTVSAKASRVRQTLNRIDSGLYGSEKNREAQSDIRQFEPET